MPDREAKKLTMSVKNVLALLDLFFYMELLSFILSKINKILNFIEYIRGEIYTQLTWLCLSAKLDIESLEKVD